MSIRTIATLAVAIVLGLIAVLILNNYLAATNKAKTQVATGAGTPVVVAAQPIARGTTLQQPLLKMVSYPQGSVPAGAFQSIQQLVGAQGTQRLALRNLVANEPILNDEVTGPGGKVNLASVLDPGMQAVAIRSTDVAGVGGFVLPGDQQVDVLLTRSVSSGTRSVNTIHPGPCRERPGHGHRSVRQSGFD